MRGSPILNGKVASSIKSFRRYIVCREPDSYILVFDRLTTFYMPVCNTVQKQHLRFTPLFVPWYEKLISPSAHRFKPRCKREMSARSHREIGAKTILSMKRLDTSAIELDLRAGTGGMLLTDIRSKS